MLIFLKELMNIIKIEHCQKKRFLYNTLQETFKIFADYHDDFYNIYSENLKYLKMKQPDGRRSSSLSTDIERAGTQTSTVKA